jgi:hypothetical protein
MSGCGATRTWRDVPGSVAIGGKADIGQAGRLILTIFPNGSGRYQITPRTPKLLFEIHRPHGSIVLR